MNITSLGEARFPSPVSHTVSDQARIPAVIVRDPAAPKRDEVLFELAGPRAKLFFDPAKTRAGIVTCGGLCPGLNNVIRALFLELHHLDCAHTEAHSVHNGLALVKLMGRHAGFIAAGAVFSKDRVQLPTFRSSTISEAEETSSPTSGPKTCGHSRAQILN